MAKFQFGATTDHGPGYGDVTADSEPEAVIEVDDALSSSGIKVDEVFINGTAYSPELTRMVRNR